MGRESRIDDRITVTSRRFPHIVSRTTRQDIDLRDDFAISIHQDVDHITIKPLAVPGTTRVRIGDAHDAIVLLGMLLIVKDPMSQLASRENFFLKPVRFGRNR